MSYPHVVVPALLQLLYVYLTKDSSGKLFRILATSNGIFPIYRIFIRIPYLAGLWWVYSSREAGGGGGGGGEVIF